MRSQYEKRKSHARAENGRRQEEVLRTPGAELFLRLKPIVMKICATSYDDVGVEFALEMFELSRRIQVLTCQFLAEAAPDIVVPPPYPLVICETHRSCSAGYAICDHVARGEAIAKHAPPTPDRLGLLLCEECIRTERTSGRLICESCARERFPLTLRVN